MTVADDELLTVPALIDRPGQVRFLRRTVSSNADIVELEVAEIDAEGRWRPYPEPVKRIRHHGRSTVVAGDRMIGCARADDAVTRRPQPGDPAWLEEHRSFISTQAAAAEQAGMARGPLTRQIAAWTTFAQPDTQLDLGYRSVKALGALDGSLGWLGAACVLGSSWLSGRPQWPLGVLSTPLLGSGRLDHHSRLSGSWSAIPGSTEADWVVLPVAEVSGELPAQPTAVLLPARQVVFRAGPRHAGLAGSDDHRIEVHDLPIDPDSILRAGPDGPLGRLRPALLRTVLLAALCSGLATALVDGVIELSRTKVRSGNAEPLLADPAVLAATVTAFVELAALDAAVQAQLADLGSAGGPEQLARVFCTARRLGRAALEQAERVFRPVGASALFQTSPMQRQLRDLMTVGTYFDLDPTLVRAATATLLGNPTPHPDLDVTPATSKEYT